MCSSECPCQSVDARPWTDLGETKLNLYNRTLVQKSGTSTNANALTDANGNYRVVTSTNTSATYTTFQVCNEHLKEVKKTAQEA